ncbi:Aminotransferase class-III [Candidatus Promineifilum breve]|uniref:Aminotransferase class-III n=1 Tax=Candidatus Promineifilum breve TaxID=1806508 RepID=A0A160T5L9_9CHLR|nr:aminotransferase class III-fold pyridoxal phosphate-dependent enzyme [Candidatus Promineifilum breve]CUS05234.2 Aminotransferase class-III [Candidatus Promineifilum breve]
MPNTVRLDQDYPTITESEKLHARAAGLIPAFAQTLAKGPTQYVDGVAPKYLRRAKGARVWDVDGNEYLDYNMAIGPISLGYGYEPVDAAVRGQLEDGIVFPLIHPLEVEIAELVREVIPNAESVRYAKAGAEVTSAAVRLARAYTGRDKVLCCGYHGWHDWYIGITARNLGVPQAVKDLVYTFNYNDMDSVMAALDDDTACVILEPMTFDFPKDDFLQKLKDACHAKGALLIFDEMWTGFRWALGGAQEYFGVTADLACYSKAIANGMPLAVLAGRADVMSLLDEHVFFFTTFGGETLSLAAAGATIRELRDKDVPAELARKGQKLMDGYNDIATELGLRDVTHCKGHPARGLIFFDDKGGQGLLMKSLVQQELIKRGILWSGFHNMCYSHTEDDLAYTLEAYGQALAELKAGLENDDLAARLRGKPVQPVFRRTDSFNLKPAR